MSHCLQSIEFFDNGQCESDIEDNPIHNNDEDSNNNDFNIIISYN